jgi:hypothetical protein
MADPEITAMRTVADALADLDQAARERVLKWAAARYEVKINLAEPTARTEDADGGAGGADDGSADGSDAEFEHFAELFDAAAPTTNEDKALVAGYWIQVLEGNDQWSASTLNTQLKNLGHAIPNITTALSGSMKKQPKRVIQLKKSGSSRQARKTYKLTTEGIKVVKRMLSPGES